VDRGITTGMVPVEGSPLRSTELRSVVRRLRLPGSARRQ